MFILVNPCETSSVLKTVYFILQLLKVAAILIPIGLIVMLTIDFAKSIISSEDEMEKHKKLAIKRIIMCIFLFLVPSIVKISFNILHNSEIIVNYTKCIAFAKEETIGRFEEQEAVIDEIIENDVTAPKDKKSARIIVSKKNSNGEKNINSSDIDETVASTSAKELTNALNKMSQAAQKGGWTYTNSGTSGSFKKAVKSNNKKTNCAKYISWGLIQVGVLESGQYFYKCYGGSHCSGNSIIYSSDKAKKRMEAKLTYINGKGKTAGSLIKNGKLQKGDIVLWQNVIHTNAYAGNNKWYDAGRWAANGASGDLKFKTFGPVRISSLDHWRVWKILRIKE